MALSYNLGYQESISVHPTRRQIFAGKPYSTFPNIWEWLIYFQYESEYENFAFLFVTKKNIYNSSFLWQLWLWFAENVDWKQTFQSGGAEW